MNEGKIIDPYTAHRRKYAEIAQKWKHGEIWLSRGYLMDDLSMELDKISEKRVN
jgi:hypothetical protein